MPLFFVRVFAPDATALVKLATYGLDLFRGSAIRARAGLAALGAEADALADQGWSDPDSAEGLASAPYVDGLLSIEDVARLVFDGYRVLINDDANQRARAQTETVEFEAWLKGMEG